MKRYVSIAKMIDASAWIGWAGHRHWVEHEEVHALLADLRGEVEKLPHVDGCRAEVCDECGEYDWNFRHVTPERAVWHEFNPKPCTCPRGRVLVMLEANNA